MLLYMVNRRWCSRKTKSFSFGALFLAEEIKSREKYVEKKKLFYISYEREKKFKICLQAYKRKCMYNLLFTMQMLAKYPKK